MAQISPESSVEEWSSTSSSGPGLLSVLWRRKALLLLGLTIGVVLGILYYFQQVPRYQSSADLVVWKRRADPLPVSNGVDSRVAVLEDYVGTQSALLRSHEVLLKAGAMLHKNRAKLRDLPQTTPEGLIGYLQNGLTISRPKDPAAATTSTSNILNVAFRSTHAQDAQEIVNAVLRGYQESLGGNLDTARENDLEKAKRIQEDVEKQITNVSNDLEKLQTSIQDQSQTPLSEIKTRIAGAESRLIDFQEKKLDTESRLQQIRRGIADQKDPKLLLVLFQVTSNKPDRPIAQEPVKQVDDVLLTMKLQEEELLQNFGADHPQVVAIRKRMSTIRDHLEKNATATNAANPTTSATDLIHLYVQILEEEKKKNEEIQKSLRANLESDRGIVRPLELLAHRETTLKDQREYLKKRLFNLEEGRKTIELTRDAPLYDFRIINPAGEGGKVSPIATSTVSLGAILGLLLGIGLAFLAEFTDQSFHSAEEIRRRLGVSVIGHIPPLTPHEATAPDQQALDPMLVVHHRPPSMEAEAHRGLRTSLYFSTVGKGHQVIQITSPNPHDGKSTIIANLAVSIAQSGKKIVLIDCDFRKPRIHQIFGLATSEVGLASVLLQEADLDQAIQTCAVAGLHLLPCGPRPTNPAELLSSQRYRELLDQIRTRYDFVLIDTPPLLAVSDPAVVSTQVGGVILVTRLTKTARPAAERAKEILSAMGANLLGVVVNDSEAARSSYNYGYDYQYAEDYSEEKTDERTASSDLLLKSR